MKTTKKILSIFLALLMIISIIPMSSITASAASVMKTQAEAVAWLNQQTNSLYGGGQCTEFVSAYMNWLITGSATASGSYIVPQWPQGYVTFAQSDPQNWTVIKNEISTVPQPGDIFVSGNTHTGVVIVPDGTRGATIVDQNSRAGYGENGTRSQIIYKNWTTYSGGPYTVTYFIRPKFKNANVSTTGISLNLTSFTLETGQTKTLTATVTPSNATDKSVTWNSSNTSVATVSSSGVVTAKAGGTCTITATNSGGQKATATVNVTSGSLRICVDGNSNNQYWNLTLGGTESTNCYLSINEYYGNSIKYSYSTNNSNVSCSLGNVNSSNQAPFSVYANSIGETTITISVKDAITDTVLDTINVYVTVDTKPSYTVSFDANGGTGAPSSQTKYFNENLTLSSTKPTRSGYTFVGWGTSSGDTSVDYYAGGTYTQNANITLYAIWKENVKTYTVTFDANGGTGAPASQTKYHNQVLELSSTIPKRSGYTFLGWSTSSTATSASYLAGSSFTTDANTTLYAVWCEVQSIWELTGVDVTYLFIEDDDPNYIYETTENRCFVPTEDRTYIFSTVGDASTSVTLYDENWNELAYNSGYVNYNEDDENCRLEWDFVAGQKYYFVINLQFGKGDSFTVRYKLDGKYNLTYDANRGSGFDETYVESAKFGENITLKDCLVSYTGYTFLGWSTNSAATVATYEPGEIITIYDDMTLYAVWQKNAVAEPEIHVSSTSVNLTLGETENIDIYAWATDIAVKYTLRYEIKDTNLVTCSWGGWTNDKRCPLTITAKSKGATTVTILLMDYETQAVLDSVTVTVNVGVSENFVDFSIKDPSTTTIRYKDGIALHIDGYIPDGARVEWAIDSNAFDGGTYDNGMSCLLVSQNNGYATVIATLYDANGNVIATDSVELRSKAGFFDKIGGFFRSLFGTTTVYDA